MWKLLFIALLLSVSWSQIFINDCTQLQNISTSNSSNFYLLMQEIDCNGMSFTPLQNFSGTLDGNGYSINNLNVTTTSLAGLVANLSGIIQNLHISGSFILGNSSGAFAGMISPGGCVINSTSLYNKIYGSDANFSYVGGIAGQNFGNISYCETRFNSIFASACSNSSQAYAGGISGWQVGNISNCAIDQSNITAVGSGQNCSRAYAGGSSGYQEGNITFTSSNQNCIKAVTDGRNRSDAYAGGLTGFQNGNCSCSHTFQNDIVAMTNAAHQSSVGRAGGIAAQVDMGFIANCSYYQNTLIAKMVGDCAAQYKNSSITNCCSSQLFPQFVTIH